jgi:hypothetical protein
MGFVHLRSFNRAKSPSGEQKVKDSATASRFSITQVPNETVLVLKCILGVFFETKLLIRVLAHRPGSVRVGRFDEAESSQAESRCHRQWSMSSA